MLAVLPAIGVATDWNPLLLSPRSQGTTLGFLWQRGTDLAILLKMPAESLRGLLWRHVPHLHADGYLLFLLIDHADIIKCQGETATLVKLRNHLEMSVLEAVLNM